LPTNYKDGSRPYNEPQAEGRSAQISAVIASAIDGLSDGVDFLKTLWKSVELV